MNGEYVNLLINSKKEYTNQLILYIKPRIYEGFKSIYDEAKAHIVKNKIDSKLVLKYFQLFIKEIPKWSNNIVNDEYKRIINKSNCTWMDDLITAVFISYIKILTASDTNSDDISLKIPKAYNFIHKIYIDCAREFWKEPYLFYDDLSSVKTQRNVKECNNIIHRSIKETIQRLLPIDDILTKYVNNRRLDDLDISDFIVTNTVKLDTDESFSNYSVKGNTKHFDDNDMLSHQEKIKKDGLEPSLQLNAERVDLDHIKTPEPELTPVSPQLERIMTPEPEPSLKLNIDSVDLDHIKTPDLDTVLTLNPVKSPLETANISEPINKDSLPVLSKDDLSITFSMLLADNNGLDNVSIVSKKNNEIITNTDNHIDEIENLKRGNDHMVRLEKEDEDRLRQEREREKEDEDRLRQEREREKEEEDRLHQEREKEEDRLRQEREREKEEEDRVRREKDEEEKKKDDDRNLVFNKKESFDNISNQQDANTMFDKDLDFQSLIKNSPSFIGNVRDLDNIDFHDLIDKQLKKR